MAGDESRVPPDIRRPARVGLGELGLSICFHPLCSSGDLVTSLLKRLSKMYQGSYNQSNRFPTVAPRQQINVDGAPGIHSSARKHLMITLQILGSLAILTGFALAQLGRLQTTDVSYLLINLVGAIALGLPALVTGQWGFVLLEGAWLLIAIFGLIKRPRASASPTVPDESVKE